MSAPENQTNEPAPSYAAPQSHELAPPEEPARMGAAQRFVGTLFSPGETFEDVNRKPTWLVPTVIAVVCSVVFIWFLLSHFEEGWRHFMQKALESRGGPAPAGQDLERMLTITKWSYRIFAGVATVIFAVATAGIFALVMMLMQAKTTFKKVLAVVTWSWAATGVLQVIVTIASVLFRGSDTSGAFNPREIGSLSAANLSSFMPEGTSAFTKGLAGAVDVFSIWFLILVTIGLTAVAGSRKIKAGSVGRVVFGLWIVSAVIRAALAAAFGGQ